VLGGVFLLSGLVFDIWIQDLRAESELERYVFMICFIFGVFVGERYNELQYGRWPMYNMRDAFDMAFISNLESLYE